MAGVAKGERPVDRLGELQPKERPDCVRLSFTAPGAEPMEVDGAAKPTSDDDPDVLVIRIVFRIRHA